VIDFMPRTINNAKARRRNTQPQYGSAIQPRATQFRLAPPANGTDVRIQKSTETWALIISERRLLKFRTKSHYGRATESVLHRIVQFKMMLKPDLIPIQGDPENGKGLNALRPDAK
jgi:hypothetical protein